MNLDESEEGQMIGMEDSFVKNEDHGRKKLKRNKKKRSKNNKKGGKKSKRNKKKRSKNNKKGGKKSKRNNKKRSKNNKKGTGYSKCLKKFNGKGCDNERDCGPYGSCQRFPNGATYSMGDPVLV